MGAFWSFECGDIPAAQQQISEGLSLSPNNTGLLILRAKIHTLTGKFAEAQADLNEIIQKSPNDDWAHGQLALLRVAQRDRVGANASAAAALKLNATQPEALLALAQLDLAESKDTEAIAKLERNLTANPDFSEARLFYATLLAKNGQTTKAVAELESLCQRNPYALAARERLIAYYAREANKPEEAWRHIRELEKIKHPKAKQCRSELEQMLKTKSP